MAFSNKHLTQGEHVELEFRTHAKRIIGPLLVILSMIVLGVLAYLFLPDDGRPWTLVAVLVLCAIVAIVWGLIPIWKWRNTVFVLTNRRLITRTGIMAKSGRDIPLYRINDVQYEKGVSDRMLGCGTLLISDASDQPQLRLDDIPHVESVQVKINELLFAHFGDGQDRPDSVPAAGRGNDRRQDRLDDPRDRGRSAAPDDREYGERARSDRDYDRGYDDRGRDQRGYDERGYDQQGHERDSSRGSGDRPYDNQPRVDPRDGAGPDQTRPLPRQDDPPQRY